MTGWNSPGRPRSGCPSGPLSFGPPRSPAPDAGFFRRPVQPVSGSLHRRPGDLVRCAVPCPRHSRPAGGSQRLQPEGPVRCAAPAHRSSQPAAGSPGLPMQDRVSSTSFRSYRPPPGTPLSSRHQDGYCRFQGQAMPPDPSTPRPRALPCRHPVPHEGRVNGAPIIKGLFRRQNRKTLPILTEQSGESWSYFRGSMRGVCSYPALHLPDYPPDLAELDLRPGKDAEILIAVGGDDDVPTAVKKCHLLETPV
jgi:hypothetical protein